jgi:hypothetical protein
MVKFEVVVIIFLEHEAIFDEKKVVGVTAIRNNYFLADIIVSVASDVGFLRIRVK